MTTADDEMAGTMEGDGLERLNALDRADAEAALLACCSSPAWATAVAGRRPFADAAALFAAADAALEALGEDDVDEALAGHPRIGEREPGPGGRQSRREQSGVEGAQVRTLEAIAEGNRAYENRFGHVYLVRATGRSADELLEILRGRLDNDPATERRIVRQELAAINRIRLTRLLEVGAP